VSPSLGGFEGFDLTNPRGRFGGERFHLACPKLGLGDAILSHTILARFYISAGGFFTATGTGREGGRTIGGFQQGGRTILGERFVVGDWQGFWRFYHLGFHCRALDIRSSPFMRSFRCYLIY
jgi:hypothetical protein